ncbi:hypothetical protein [Actinomadura parmotrematis]|uniref:SPFH domain-containing protein n=1 Tax=Actinomadura parmotrematis TaxID=2864039 RepID=A0ABS7G278_9ACTN|nr:hypothetical protein [Actinomadura parmotrematis]MBW8485937.1 hypothetical protein [Actinomadura parmotrematis]
MDQPTYDPIIEERDIPRIRVLNPVRAPRAQEAVVLEPGDGPLRTFRHGAPIPGARLSDYRRMYLVDVSEHRLLLDFALLSHDPNYAFMARADLFCQVSDPAKVVQRNIRDVSGALHGPLRRMLQDVSKHYDVSAFHAAQEALNEEMRFFSGDAALELHGISIELLIDDEEMAESGRELRKVVREQRLGDMRADHRLDRLRRDGVEGVIAEIMEKQGAAAALDRIQDIERSERQELLAAWDTVLKHGGDELEPHQLAEAQQQLLNLYTEGSSAPFGGTRPRRLRGSMAPELEGTVKPALPAPARADEAAGRRAPVVHPGSVGGEPAPPSGERAVTEPPEDEPLGGSAVPDASGGAAVPPGPPAAGPRASRLRGFRTGEPDR